MNFEEIFVLFRGKYSRWQSRRTHLQMPSFQRKDFRYPFDVRHPRYQTIFLLMMLGAMTASAINPQPETESPLKKSDMDLPVSQEATEESVLPEEPFLTPPPAPATKAPAAVQPLPPADILQPSGPTEDDRRKLLEKFRATKTEAEEQFTLADLKVRAFQAGTEREKRALLREYYREVEKYMIRQTPAVRELAMEWSYRQQMRLARVKTEPDYQPPQRPAGMAGKKDSTEETTSRKVDILPVLER